MGRPTDPRYYSKWRAAHPDYVARERGRKAARRRRLGRGDRSAEYKARWARQAGNRPPPPGPLPLLYPELQRGTVVAFWDDELRIDLAQEAQLAALEGSDTCAAVRAYRCRELDWYRRIRPLPDRLADDT